MVAADDDCGIKAGFQIFGDLNHCVGFASDTGESDYVRRKRQVIR